jgi:5-methylcytosine-specific restriction endonuclease McrA
MNQKFCAEHADIPKAKERERSRRRREKTNGAYKTAMWQHRRQQAIARAGGHCACKGCPECRPAFGFNCGRTELDVHHIVPLERGGAAYDPQNHMALCPSCHAEWHRQDRRRESRSDDAA